MKHLLHKIKELNSPNLIVVENFVDFILEKQVKAYEATEINEVKRENLEESEQQNLSSGEEVKQIG